MKETDLTKLDEHIRRPLKSKKPKESFFGKSRNVKPFEREEIDRVGKKEHGY